LKAPGGSAQLLAAIPIQPKHGCEAMGWCFNKHSSVGDKEVESQALPAHHSQPIAALSIIFCVRATGPFMITRAHDDATYNHQGNFAYLI